MAVEGLNSHPSDGASGENRQALNYMEQQPV